jgi:cytochrome P450
MDVHLDPTDLTFIEDPYPTLNRIREEVPIFRSERFGLWFITRHTDVHAGLRDRRLGRVFDHVTSHEELGVPPRDPRYQAFWKNERYSLLDLEPPEHSRLRTLVARAFTPKRVAGMRPRIRQSADDLLDRLLPRGEFDLLHDFNEPFSVRVVCEMLGVPVGDWRRNLAWSHAIVKMYELDSTEEQAVAANQAAAEHAAYMRGLIAERRERPKEDLISALVQVETDEGRLTEDEIVSTCILLLNAGHEATVNALANGVHALMRHPEQWQRLRTAEVPSKHAVEEFFRYDGPLQMFERWVLADDFEVEAHHVPFGDKVAFLFGSANRDPRQFPDAETFDVGRNDTTHVGFGGGTHYCLGAPLARLEVEVALERIVERCPNLELAAERPVRNPTFVQRAFSALPVKV